MDSITSSTSSSTSTSNWTATTGSETADLVGSNASAFGQPETDLLQEVVAIVVPILFAIIVIVGLLGNSLVVIVVKCNPTVSERTDTDTLFHLTSY